MEIRPKWTNEELDAIFNKGKTSSIFPMPEYRVDDYGNLMARSKYGNANSQLGWEVDHIKSIKDGGTNEFGNLRPLNISKNRGR
jgi:hypothetical protein